MISLHWNVQSKKQVTLLFYPRSKVTVNLIPPPPDDRPNVFLTCTLHKPQTPIHSSFTYTRTSTSSGARWNYLHDFSLSSRFLSFPPNFTFYANFSCQVALCPLAPVLVMPMTSAKFGMFHTTPITSFPLRPVARSLEFKGCWIPQSSWKWAFWT